MNEDVKNIYNIVIKHFKDNHNINIKPYLVINAYFGNNINLSFKSEVYLELHFNGLTTYGITEYKKGNELIITNYLNTVNYHFNNEGMLRYKISGDDITIDEVVNEIKKIEILNNIIEKL